MYITVNIALDLNALDALSPMSCCNIQISPRTEEISSLYFNITHLYVKGRLRCEVNEGAGNYDSSTLETKTHWLRRKTWSTWAFHTDRATSRLPRQGSWRGGGATGDTVCHTVSLKGWDRNRQQFNQQLYRNKEQNEKQFHISDVWELK